MTVKIGVVGDLSGGDPQRLATVLDQALVACDYVVQVGDLDPAYDKVSARLQQYPHKLFCVPGNHDVQFDTLGCPRQWRYEVGELPMVTMIGLDNSTGSLSEESKAQFEQPAASPFELVFAHMAPVALVLPDGSLNTHTMVEGGPNADADWLAQQLDDRDAAMFCGHYHGFTYQQAPFGSLIVEGRGGAAPELAYTLVTVVAEGWVLHSVAC
jgi:predicted phosphodiesterase